MSNECLFKFKKLNFSCWRQLHCSCDHWASIWAPPAHCQRHRKRLVNKKTWKKTQFLNLSYKKVHVNYEAFKVIKLFFRVVTVKFECLKILVSFCLDLIKSLSKTETRCPSFESIPFVFKNSLRLLSKMKYICD